MNRENDPYDIREPDEEHTDLFRRIAPDPGQDGRERGGPAQRGDGTQQAVKSVARFLRMKGISAEDAEALDGLDPETQDILLNDMEGEDYEDM